MSDAAIRAYASERRFGPAMLARWLGQPAEDRAQLLRIAVRLRLGEQQFRDILEQVEDIATHRRCTVGAVLDSDAITAVLARSLGRNETIRLIKSALRRLRYPQLTDVEARLAALTRQLRLPAGVRVEFPEHLEGDTISITVPARTAQALRQQMAEVTARLQGAEVDEIFRLLGGDW